MKKMYLGIAIIAVLFGASLFNVGYLDGKIGELLGYVQLSEQQAEENNFASAAETLQEAMDMWNSMGGYTHVFIRHSEIDNTTDAFCDLMSALSAADEGAAVGGYEKITCHLQSISDMEHVSIGSIF